MGAMGCFTSCDRKPAPSTAPSATAPAQSAPGAPLSLRVIWKDTPKEAPPETPLSVTRDKREGPPKPQKLKSVLAVMERVGYRIHFYESDVACDAIHAAHQIFDLKLVPTSFGASPEHRVVEARCGSVDTWPLKTPRARLDLESKGFLAPGTVSVDVELFCSDKATEALVARGRTKLTLCNSTFQDERPKQPGDAGQLSITPDGLTLPIGDARYTPATRELQVSGDDFRLRLELDEGRTRVTKAQIASAWLGNGFDLARSHALVVRVGEASKSRAIVSLDGHLTFAAGKVEAKGDVSARVPEP